MWLILSFFFLRYLQVEWEVKRGGYRDFSVDHMVGSHCKVPLQDNSSDCGLYLLQYAESFLQVDLFFISNTKMCVSMFLFWPQRQPQWCLCIFQDPVLHFDLPLRLERWFPRQQVRGKREEIRDLILNLYRFQKGSLGNEALEDGTDHGNVTQWCKAFRNTWLFYFGCIYILADFEPFYILCFCIHCWKNFRKK